MTWHQRQLGVWQLAVNHVQVGAADAACMHPNAELSLAGLRQRQFGGSQWLAGLVENHGKHDESSIVMKARHVRGRRWAKTCQNAQRAHVVRASIMQISRQNGDFGH